MAGLMLCVMASLAGVPPFLGFWAKLAVLRAALQGGMLWLAIVGIVFAANALALLVFGLFWQPLMAWCQQSFT
jgi:NADH-quinone oxidoreductase subunit N